MAVQFQSVTIEWHGYATVRLEADDVVAYLDPGRYGVLTGEWEPDSEAAAGAHPSGSPYSPEDADFVCLTHVHHYDPDGIERVAAPDATVLAFDGINPRDSRRDLDRLVDLPYDVVGIGQEDETLLEDVPIWTVPAYNDPDGPHTRANGQPVHPEGFGCGFLLSIERTRVFYPGDTDVLDGHAELDVDVLLPPIGGSFTMDREGAAALAAEMAPDLVVPVHYNTFDALETDSRAFAADVAARGIPVALDEAECERPSGGRRELIAGEIVTSQPAEPEVCPHSCLARSTRRDSQPFATDSRKLTPTPPSGSGRRASGILPASITSRPNGQSCSR